MSLFAFDAEQRRMVRSLLLVAALCTLLLAVVDRFTHARVEAAKLEALQHSLLEVLPAHANDPVAAAFVFGEGKEQRTLYPAQDAAGQLLAVAWKVTAPDGYAGNIEILLGVDPYGAVTAMRIVSHHETPGLADRLTEDAQWLAAFAGKRLDNANWAVKKDGGQFDQFAGATISPRAVVKAVKGGLQWYAAQRELLLARFAPPAPASEVAP